MTYLKQPHIHLMKIDREDIILKLVGVLYRCCLSFSTQLDLVVRAEVIEYLETFIKNDSKGLAVLSKNKYELVEFDIDARFYK